MKLGNYKKMKTSKYWEYTPVPFYWSEELKNKFYYQIEELEKMMTDHVHSIAKNNPMGEEEFSKNRLKVRIEPMIILKNKSNKNGYTITKGE